MRPFTIRVALVFFCAAIVRLDSVAGALQVSIEGVSLSASGLPASEHCAGARVSADGRFAVFTSLAGDLVPGDANGSYDVFVRDRLLGATSLASPGTAGGAAHGNSLNPDVSGDGRFVVFQSDASDLVPGLNTLGHDHVYVYDVAAASVALVDVSPSGKAGGSLAVAASISADGRFIAFASRASNLVTGDTNNKVDVFVRDRSAGTTVRVSESTAGVQANDHFDGNDTAISGDGRFVVFGSRATNLVPGVDANGALADVFRKDLATGQLVRLSESTSGAQGSSHARLGGVDDAGRWVVFTSDSVLAPGDTGTFSDVYLRDAVAGSTLLVSKTAGGVSGNEDSVAPCISADGAWIAFESDASDLVPADTNGASDVFLQERVSSARSRVNVTPAGAQSQAAAYAAGFARGGATVVFSSFATDLVPGQANGKAQVFAADRASGAALHCSAKTNSLGCVPAIRAFGIPSAANLQGFSVHAREVRNQKPGLLFYGLAGPASLAFQCGTLCVAAPLRRTPAVSAGGNPPPADDCSGVFSIDLSSFAHGLLGGSPQPALRVPGSGVDVQWWGRDQGFAAPCNTTLSNALSYVVVL